MLNRLFAVAPMLDWTDRHCRYFYRLMTKESLLYTEMIVSDAILFGPRERLLAFNSFEKPLALQLGGSDPLKLAECTKIAVGYGYDEINLNVGCPSNRVQAGRFGACLMAEPDLVADSIAAMQYSAGLIPVTVKTRLGIDNQDSYENLVAFIAKVSAAGCKTFILHARKAWLNGLNPKQNREIPPLRYDVVQQIKRDFPQLEIILNGGINNLTEALSHLTSFDGVMLGRSIYQNPFQLADVDRLIYGKLNINLSRQDVLEQFIPYVEAQIAAGVALSSISRHIINLFHTLPGAKLWRRSLSNYNEANKLNLISFKQAVEQISSYSTEK